MAKPQFVSLQEAIGEIKNGDMLTFGGFTIWRRPMAAIYELIRQGKKDLHLVEVNGGTHDDMLAGAGCLKAWESCWCGHELYGKFGANLARKIENGDLIYVDHPHMHMLYRFFAGSHGLPFMPTYAAMGSDQLDPKNDGLAKAGLRDGSNPKIAKVQYQMYHEEFNNTEICLVPAAKPNWCINHVHMVGSEGTVRIEGLDFSDVEAMKASEKNIVICEKVVPEEYLRREPKANQIPWYLVDYIVELPWGAHPTGLFNLYETDGAFISDFYNKTRTQEGFDKWADEWIFGVKDFNEYLNKLGRQRLDVLQAVPGLGYSMKLKRGSRHGK